MLMSKALEMIWEDMKGFLKGNGKKHIFHVFKFSE